MITFGKNERFNNCIKGLLTIVIYFFISFERNLPFDLLHIDYDSLPLIVRETYTISLEILILIIIFKMFKGEIIKAWQDLKKNHMKYFSENFKYYLFGLLLMLSSNLLINILGGGMSGNETEIRNQFNIAPIFTFVSSVFIAPFVEEGIFRLSFRNVFKNNFIFVLMSGLVFGGLHLLAGVDTNLLFLYLVAYGSFGIVFAYMLVKTNNIFVSTSFHLMHNGIFMSLQVLIFLLG